MDKFPPRAAKAGHTVHDPSARMVPQGHYAEEGQGSGIEQLLHPDEEGYIVGRLGNRALRLKTDGHIVTVAPTRSGKGTSCIIPNLLDHPGSAFVIDIRGDTIARTADARLLMGQDVVVLDPYKVTEGRWGYDFFNPLDILKPGQPGFEQHVRRTSQAIMFDPEGRGSKEPLWDNATMLALNGALTYIKTCLPPEMQQLQELFRLFSLQPERRAEVAKEFALGSMTDGATYERTLDVFTEFMTAGSQKTKVPDNTVVQIMTLLEWAGHQEFKEILSRSTFSFDRMQTRPTTVYLVLPEEYIKGCEVWVRLIFNAALFQLKEVNTLFGRTSNALKQSERVLFLLDEFPAFGRLQPVEDGMATVAGRGATLWLFIQHISQLDRIYNEHSARQIIGNASLIQAFNSNEIHEQEYFSRVIGEEMFDVQTVTVGTTTNKGGGKGTSHTITLGNSESITLGKNRSATTGESHSATDGTSYGKTFGRNEGTSQSTTTGVSDTAGDSFTTQKGTNWGSGTSSGASSGGSRGVAGKHYLLDYLGSDIPLHQTKNSGENWGRNHGRNWSQGGSQSTSRSTSQSRSTSHSQTGGTSRGTSESESFTANRSQTHGTSRSETEGTSESRTAGTSRSEAASTSENENWSQGETVSYAVKPEQRKIETPRSLRRTMSNGNQLLALRGHYAFLAPRLMYFEREADPEHTQEYYRFPKMALLSGETTLANIWLTYRHLYIAASHDVLGPDFWLSLTLTFNDFTDLVKRHLQGESNSNPSNGRSPGLLLSKIPEAVGNNLTAIDECRAEYAEASDILFTFVDFMLRFSGDHGKDVAGNIDENSAIRTMRKGALMSDWRENTAIKTLQRLALFAPGVAESLEKDANLGKSEAPWLLKHYAAPMKAAYAAFQASLEDEKRAESLKDKACGEVQELIDAVEFNMSEWLVGAMERQRERRMVHREPGE